MGTVQGEERVGSFKRNKGLGGVVGGMALCLQLVLSHEASGERGSRKRVGIRNDVRVQRVQVKEHVVE
ncbi:hypothetical protein E2C01_022860 [Portunus trituberculatus]|uniref:Uncharacterized protein n=1 Tax=Portunus trituberculatus TaxID=210409 RepID=A0A5B7E7A1_PORTR|nr:hypothetical protein [Portunus trituberculatus]